MATAIDQPPSAPAGDGLPLSAVRRGLRLLGLVATVLVLGLSVAYAWQSRQRQINAASIESHQHVARLASDLTETLAVGQAVLQQAQARLAGLAPGRPLDDALAALAAQQQPLLAAQPIPFTLQAHDASGQVLGRAAALAGPGLALHRIQPPTLAAGWSPEVPVAGGDPALQRLVLARAVAPNAAGIAAFSVAMQQAPLIRRFDAVRHQPGGSVALLRVEPDGRGITVLARVPPVDGAVGRLIQGPVARALPTHRMGWVEDSPQIDGLRRVMAYQRLEGQAGSLVLIYSLRMDDVLLAWRTALPWQALATGLLLVLLLGGLAWLDRALRRLEVTLAALGQSETRLRTLADNLPDVVLRLDRGLRLVFANPAIEPAVGLRPAQLLGRTLIELGPPLQAQVAAWTLGLGRVFSGGQTERLEFDLPGADGLRHWESKLVPELGADGQVQSALVISRDVSDRVRHAEALARSELRFRLAATHGQVWEWDLAAGRVQIPAVWWQSLGHPVPPVAQMLQAFESILHPDDHALWHRVLRDHLRGHQPYALMVRVASAHDGWHWQQTQGQSTRDDQGRAVYMAGTNFDVTDRELALQAVRDSQRRLAYLLANSPAVIYTARPDGGAGATYYSPNVPDLLGYAAQRFIAEPGFWLAQVHPDDRARTLAQLAQMRVAGHCVLEYRFQRADGQWRWLLDDVRLARDAAGQPLELIGSMVDVTDRHLAEEAVRSLNADLENRVRQRTAQLQASEARLQRINSELETFSYSVSHDLKAPLRGIDGYSQLLLRDHAAGLDAEAQAFLASIRAATLQMGQLIDDLLAYSQLERRSLAQAPLPLRELVQQVLADLPAQAQAAVLHNQVPAGLQALGDAQGLRMALRNLVDNALKFGRPSVQTVVTVTGERCDTPSGPAVRLAVQDNGIGFDMKYRDRIFGIFQRLHRSEHYPGTGVGLAIVRKAMDRMGGQAQARSEPGQGAVFTLDMPVVG